MLDKETIDEVMRTRAAHIEKFAAAFIKEVGCGEASKYRLVEAQDKSDPTRFRVTWEFQLREEGE